MKIPNGIKGLLIDLDDTILIDGDANNEAFLHTGQLVHSRYKVDPIEFANTAKVICNDLWNKSPNVEFTKQIGHGAEEGLWSVYGDSCIEFQNLKKWTPTFRKEVWSEALKEHNVEDSAFADELVKFYKQKRQSLQKLYPNTKEKLKELGLKYKLGLLTNGTPKLQGFKIEATQLEPYFDNILISGEIRIGKPDKRIFLEILKRLNLKPSEALMIGNSLKADIQGAKNTGMESILVTEKQRFEDIS